MERAAPNVEISERYDVVIIGGAAAGGSTATLLRREAPALRVLIVEKQAQFDEKVGEATTEMSAMFLTRRLALWQHLEREHLPKEGLRYWFYNERVDSHATASESGGFLRSTVPSFQLRRDVLDEAILAQAVGEGAELLRPARVVDLRIGEFDHELTLEHGSGVRSRVGCRWVIDASGRARVIGQRLGLIERNDEHPTASIWCRWKNVRHIDDIAARGPIEFAARNVGSRRLATNHYPGFGYWIWVIPLGNGETSIGVVFDKRHVDLHQVSAAERPAAFVAFLKQNPALAELLDGAEPRFEDLRYYSQLAYVSRQYMGAGWALVGDAAAFLDPYYSPGLDHVAFSSEATVQIVAADHRGESIETAVREHNETFLRSYRRFFEAVYKDKYRYMGEHDLLTASFLIDTAQYYVFVVIPAYRFFKRFHWMPVLGPKPAGLNFRLMRLYNRRLGKLALLRQEMGEAGQRNDRRRISAYFALDRAPLFMALRGLRLWARAEFDGLRLRLKRLVRGAAATAPAAKTEPLSPSPSE
jgi:flavin-dependent dehydrogenase